MMNRQELNSLWVKHDLTARYSYKPEFIQKIAGEFGITKDEVDSLIYTQTRYRELHNDTPRVDAEDFLIMIAKKHNITPNEKDIELANKMMGEGSRRECIENAYIGGVE
jgi:hypothetical protein